MKRYNFTQILLISIAMTSLAILLVTFGITTDIIIAIQVMLIFYGGIAFIGLMIFLSEQYEINEADKYRAKTQLVNDRVNAVKELESLAYKQLEPKSEIPEDVTAENDRILRDANNTLKEDRRFAQDE